MSELSELSELSEPSEVLERSEVSKVSEGVRVDQAYLSYRRGRLLAVVLDSLGERLCVQSLSI